MQAALHQSENLADDAGERNAGLHQDISHKAYYRQEVVKTLFPVTGMKRRMTPIREKYKNRTKNHALISKEMKTG